MSGTRTQAERDAVTVEIMFALVSGAFVGGLGFGALSSATLWAGLPDTWSGPWLAVSGIVGGVLCGVRVVRVLRRMPRRPAAGPSVQDVVWIQPSQPGRTNPDS
ncbi:DUF6332 family protein [Streptomyces decoyicus]|uniref:DUF6332 family protein n=1 Tax=Streptomyces decoyicus TaxID=249567 RepID=UPI0006BF0583|nr:DUF6332 family protein [Streptomyces decoyicus]KOG37604.1 hypothetical protein ADK74_36125 [Streptomyces decoyicus]QZY14775.1 DUF6332 family protein [Streptomyces decoyicus]